MKSHTKGRPAPTSNPTIEILERRIAPATFLVFSLTDGAGAGTLRKAIADANTAPGADEIVFKTFGKIKLTSELPTITDDVTFVAKKSITLDGQKQHGILAVSGANVDVVMENLKLINGKAETGAALKIDTTGGTVLFKKGVVKGNRATGNGTDTDAEGGGIALLNGSLTIQNSVISGNVADTTALVDDGYGVLVKTSTGEGKGGGIFVSQGTVVIQNTKISGNKAIGNGRGGGIMIEAGSLMIQDKSKLIGNLAQGSQQRGNAYGGAIYVSDGVTVSATGITISKNIAKGSNGMNGAKGANGERGARATEPGEDGGDGGNGEDGATGTDASDAFGGGIYSKGNLTLANSVVSGNSVLGGKGGNGGNGGNGGAGGAGGPKSTGGGGYGGGYDDYGGGNDYGGGQAGRRGYGGSGGQGGGAGVGGSAKGGGIFNGSFGTVTIQDTTISGNIAKVGADGTKGKAGVRGAGRSGGGYNYGGGYAAVAPAGLNNYDDYGGDMAVVRSAEGGAIFNESNGTVTIHNTTISRNSAKAEGGSKAGAGIPTSRTAFGGGIQNFGTVTLDAGSKVKMNVVAAGSGAGGGISNTSATAELNITNATISGNKVTAADGAAGSKGTKGPNGGRGAVGENGGDGEPGTDGGSGTAGGYALGGGIYNLGVATIETSTVSGNTVSAGSGGNGGNGGAGGAGGAGGRGGRYTDEYGDTTVISPGKKGAGASGGAGGNAGAAGRGAGGGIYNAASNTATEGNPEVLAGGSLTIGNSTISGNKTKTGVAGKAGKGGAKGAGGTEATAGEAGAAAPSSGSGGGGVFSENGTLEIVQATIAKNIAGGEGGGVKIIGASAVASIVNSTIAANTAKGPGGGLFVGLDTVEVISTIIAKNIVKPASLGNPDVSGTIVSNSNLIGGDPKLGPLKLNGGTTATMLPLSGSPALNQGSNPNALTTDQRGFSRVFGAGIDIGAVEAGSVMGPAM